ILAPWLADAERICECSLDVCRFRPNLFADEIIGADDEAALLGAVLAIGPDVRLRVTKRIERCVTITYDPDSDAVNPAILRALAQRRDAILGVYCEVLATGEISAEDTISRI
ncbi:MAG TPA: MOSC domain-containing protein, partial [Candidatus Dormibacteraeota bacterium]|nr:MOSC domain-containing protein [Candidatus Dormibacteraeota bacterium]